jgi:uncharacterized Zn finger protein
MERICRQNAGLFPSPKEIALSCNCPDWADMCKHVAAVLYGIGARFDKQPELLFRLHDVDHAELIANAGKAAPMAKAPAASKILGSGDLSGIFGLDMAQGAGAKPISRKAPAAKKTAVASAGKTKARKPVAKAASRKKAPQSK